MWVKPHIREIRFLYFTLFSRADAGDSSAADKFYKKAADLRDRYKPLLAGIVEKALGNDNMSDDVLDSLLLRSDILKELIAMSISTENNDRAGRMSAYYNLLVYLGNARWFFFLQY